ncbi:venom serine protease Bi-VSP-like [Zerene cesonia]|uniref:venom serine protease Bi-VSP-like n=1 Tax=Zerene cesonia TaxID=33412 RepID=UPI0018E58280|nr:venom serine protease Bi-VSP-like [Zerene cesonia]
MAREFIYFVLCVCFCAQNVFCQFGFFPNERHQQQPFFQQFPNPRRISQQISSLLHLQRENPSSNPEYIYPFTNRPISNQYDDAYRRRPNRVRFPNQNTEIPQDYVNLDNDRVTENYLNNQGNPNFIQTNGESQAENPVRDNNNNANSNGLSFEDFITGMNSNKPSFGDSLSNNVKDMNNESNGADSNVNTDLNTEKPETDRTPEPAIISSELPIPTAAAYDANTNAPFNEENVKPDSVLGGINESSFGDRAGEISSTPRAILTPVPPSQSRDNVGFSAFRERCTTVEGGSGSCISIKACEPFVKLLQTPKNSRVVDILRRSQCGFENDIPKVCCPLPGIPNTPPTAPPTTAPPPPVTSTEAASGKSAMTSDVAAITALPEPPVCGVSNASFSRVVNGIPAKLGDFPWMALLGYRSRGATSWKCGGSLITSHHVLTAAHCIHNRENELYVVRLGELDLAREDDGATPVDVLIKSLIKHELYDPQAFTDDIGILVLEKDVSFSSLIRPICIPQDEKLRSQTYEKYNPLIAGWGDVAYRGPKASHLQVAQLPVVTNAACASAYSMYKQQVIDARVLCAGHKDGRMDACQGDSGGPLMQPIWNPQTYTTFFFQIGVVSYGKKCAEPGFPGVYSRVTHFVPWIQQNVIGS